MKKFRVFVLTGALALSALSCSQVNVNVTIAPAADHGNLLVIDEANQVLNQLNLNTGTSIFYSVVGNAANQVLLDGNNAYVVVSLENKVIKFDLQNGGTPVITNFAGTPNPYAMAIDASNLYVLMSSDNTLRVLDKNTLGQKGSISLAVNGTLSPYAIAQDTNRLYVGSSIGYINWNDPGNYTNSQVLVFAKSNDTLITNISVWTNPVSFAISGTHLYIAAASQYNNTGAMQDLNLSNWTLTNIALLSGGAPAYIKINNGNLYMIDGTYGGNGGIWKMNLANGTTNLTLTNKNLKGIAFSDNKVFVSEAYGGNHVYELYEASWSLNTTYTGTGGGDIAFYQ